VQFVNYTNITDTVNTPRLIPARPAGTRFTDPGGMEG